jgi:NAD(P)-dependent dehydrogenase (short-subunit alcohol dehydrogenase family)
MSLIAEKTVIVTGAGSGLGEGIARVCHREGANVVVADIRAAAAETVAASLGRRAISVACDVRRDEQLQQLVARTLDAFGRLDGLVNNAGVNCVKPAVETTAADWENVLAVDLRASFVLSQLAVRQMLAQQPAGGSIVNIASVHTHGALPASVTYDAAKWGLIGVTKSMAIELAPQGIRINAVSPGLVATQIWEDVKQAAPDAQTCEQYFFANIPIGRTIEPAEVGETVAFLLSDRSAAIVGANIFVDGGMSSQLLSRAPFEFKPIGG